MENQASEDSGAFLRGRPPLTQYHFVSSAHAYDEWCDVLVHVSLGPTIQRSSALWPIAVYPTPPLKHPA